MKNEIEIQFQQANWAQNHAYKPQNMYFLPKNFEIWTF